MLNSIPTILVSALFDFFRLHVWLRSCYLPVPGLMYLGIRLLQTTGLTSFLFKVEYDLLYTKSIFSFSSHSSVGTKVDSICWLVDEHRGATVSSTLSPFPLAISSSGCCNALQPTQQCAGVPSSPIWSSLSSSQVYPSRLQQHCHSAHSLLDSPGQGLSLLERFLLVTHAMLYLSWHSAGLYLFKHLISLALVLLCVLPFPCDGNSWASRLQPSFSSLSTQNLSTSSELYVQWPHKTF